MPNIKSAKKKMKQDVAKKKRNNQYEDAIKKTVKKLGKTAKNKVTEELKKAYSLIDKAAKKKIIHKNKAAKLKSRITRLTKTSK